LQPPDQEDDQTEPEGGNQDDAEDEQEGMIPEHRRVLFV
jgi:hypothetical protein